ncbi:phosphoglycerate mutase-like protein [Aaosphaeria arxii CBS 175.79]|uniref:Phosphoglycerate mutase-like protein n=1 Tax=Aaosphaeria arxii CBS 175.79 TaxID=1450172 RepID=A0A6A5XP67_9PLEO|nr:phosphoglycerate mutase-like protein [Aaosphaeria arxii CBS 175.79]KAF2014696.1 phosphoglycerate mutase-like protein [Aaosphaeria arxii CBS 175.79]
MLSKTLLSVGALLAQAQAETVLGVTVFSRHGDRTSKHYKGYTLTNLGVQQNFRVGSDYRDTYISSDSSKQILGISEDKVVNSQIFATAPDQTVLLNTASAFLQGLYPPLGDINPQISTQTLNNGTNYTNPLNGYQYVVLHGEDDESPDTIWLKGDEECPAVTKSMKAFKQSTEFKERDAATKTFYEGFWDIMQSVYDYKQENLTYANAYDIFDLINVANIHNETSAGNVTEEELFQLRTLADSNEFGLAYNRTDPARSIGAQTLAGAVVNQLNETVSGKGKLKFSFMAGSYDTFLAFFGLTNLTSVSPDFFGLPDYASTMSFEVFTTENVTAFPSNTDDLRVRFLFRNGSDAGEPMRAYPLFGKSEDSLSWSDFLSSMEGVAIRTPQQWCSTCQSDLLFCQAYSAESNGAQTSNEKKSSAGMSNAVAGVIGAMVTLGVVAIAGAAAFLIMRRRRASPAVAPVTSTTEGKGSHRSDSESA